MDQRCQLNDACELALQPVNDPSAPLVLGLDIGGANIKAADSRGQTFSCSFPLWQKPETLAAELSKISQQFTPAACYAVTMTGELADCFFDRAEGVECIVRQCQQVFGQLVLFYSVDGAFLTAQDAVDLPDHVAASNWHALASMIASSLPTSGLLIDIGSTTSDIIPLCNGQPATDSRTDFDRLQTGELVYLGIGRTPVCSLVDALPMRGHFIPVMNEVFANMDDCAILLGQTQPQATDCSTCDGKPRTAEFAANRMARMIGLDHRSVSREDAIVMAEYVLRQWQARIRIATEILSPADATWILSGHGAKLLQIPSDRRCIDLSVVLGEALSRTAPAYAVANLAQAKLLNAAPVASDLK